MALNTCRHFIDDFKTNKIQSVGIVFGSTSSIVKYRILDGGYIQIKNNDKSIFFFFDKIILITAWCNMRNC